MKGSPRDHTDRRELFDRMASQLYVAVISDILDSLGFRDQVLESNIQPIDPLERRVWWQRAHDPDGADL